MKTSNVRRLALAAVSLGLLSSLGGCSYLDFKEPALKETPVSSNAVPAPVPDGMTMKLFAADNGRTIELKPGDTFSIALVGVPTAGYLWQVKSVPEFLKQGGDFGGNTTKEQSQPGFAGGNHWEGVTLSVIGRGKGDVVLEQRRPWETNEPASDTFKVTVVVQ